MILVTGSNGFVGQQVCRNLSLRGIPFRGTVRKNPTDDQVAVGDLNESTAWGSALNGVRVIIHLAARVHVMSDTEQNPIRAYREVNLEATLNLARQAHAAGVERFVFVSSVKVNGESTNDKAFTSCDVPEPCDPYGQSKMEAERALQAFGRESGMEIVIVRPPLVYGPGVKANFLNLIKLVARGLPLPLGSAGGKRSMVAVANLVDLLIVCTVHPRAGNGIFMVSDGHDLTVRELVESIANAMNKKVVLLRVPPGLIRAVAQVLGKAAAADRLLGSLQVDIKNTRERLEWEPVVTTQSAINETVSNFLASKGHNN